MAERTYETAAQPREIDRGDLAEFVGKQLGVGEWITVDQGRIDRFADATGDHQWLHVDAERAASGPFGTTVAHGYLTLSLLPLLTQSAYRVSGVRSRINYGLDRVRFPAVVPAGARVRVRATLQAMAPVTGGLRVTVHNVVELEGSERPACVADTVTLLVTKKDE